MKHISFFFSSKSNEFWKEIGMVVAEGFCENGFTVSRLFDTVPTEPFSGEVQVAVGGHEYFNTFLEHSNADSVLKVASRMVALTGEQPGSQWFSANLPVLSQCKECWDITQAGAKALGNRGVKTRHLQLGFSPVLQCTSNLSNEKVYDVFFLGSKTIQRSTRLAQFSMNNWHRNNFIRLVELNYAKTSEDQSYLNNEDRNDLASRSKIMLNYHGHLIPFLEWHRALIAMSNKALFVTDPVRVADPLIPGVHFIAASPGVINHTVEYFLENDEDRKDITERAFTYLQQELSMRRCVEIFLENQCFPPIVDPKVTAIAHSYQQKLNEFVRKKLRTHFPKRFAQECAHADPQARTFPSRKRVEEKRISIIERLELEKQAMEAGEAYEIEHFNDGRSLPPLVSVIVSLFNYQHTICTALDSLAFAVDHVENLEVIVVDDNSHDQSQIVARQWMEKSNICGKLVKKKFNTGFISSRNIGLSLASGEFVAMLDADNAFFPGGLQQLTNRATEKNLDSCYGIITCIDEQSSPCGLLSAIGWDVKRLVYGPYIDAMALFRRDIFQRIGFYDLEMFKVAWFGWEDYEYWLRLAKAGARVEHLPNFVGLYRSHSSSMINSTNLFQKEIADYLYNKYSDLVRQFGITDHVFGVPKTMISLE